MKVSDLQVAGQRSSIEAFHQILCLVLNKDDFSFPQTLPEVCSEQDELDFLMEALIIR